MTAVRGSDVLEASQVRIRSADGEVIGAGFLVAADVVCTCAHVVTGALDVTGALATPDPGTEPPEPPGDPVDLDFPLLPGRPRARATVVSWRRGGQDVALLRLAAPVPGARPAPLVDGTGVWGHTFRALGYPAGVDHGVWASGTLRAGQGAGWVQMEAQEPGPRIAGGFSGAPVWDDTQDGVVGMTVAAHRGERTAYLLPSAELVDEGTLRPRCPFRGLAAFREDDAEFFHGRDGDIARVHTAVRRRPVTLVAGPSGCGKSSLVRAGVLPRLRAAGMSVSELRPVPGVRPAAVLARPLTGLLEPELGEVERIARAEELAGLLENGDDVPAELRGRILTRAGGEGHVLFVDQLEEYAGADAAAARDLFALLAALAGEDGTAVLRVVATARPDSLDALLTAGTSDLVSDAVQFLAPLAAEDLERAVTAPVDAVPGLWFEPGLPERIVADAGDEPGRMTLVQFALTELWQRRSRSMLTHAAYDELGGVAGALIGYADETVEKLPRAQQDHARRLFVQLARPDADAFRRRPGRLTDLAPELAGLARKLAPGKLLVLSRAEDGSGELVDLAHEALTRLWPRLREWLTESRDFRAWQEQLRADLRRWQTQQREPARLLSGTELAEADRRLAAHPDDISADERHYIQLSRRHSRRGARIKRTAVGVLAALTALALVLSVTTWQSLRQTEEQLRAQAAGLLAQAAEDRPGNDPATALQLALAAWHAKDTPKTRDALMHQYGRGQYLSAVHPSVWQGQITGMHATPDGRVLVAESKPRGGNRSRFTVVTGALQGKPRARVLTGVPEGDLVTALSDDGRLFAATAGAGVRLWRLDGPGQPAVLELGDHNALERPGATLDFSGDSERLLLTMDSGSKKCRDKGRPCVWSFAEAWEVPSGDRLPVADDLVAGTKLDMVAFTSDPDSVAVSSWYEPGERQLEIRDLTSGRRLDGPLRQPGGLGGLTLGTRGEVAIRSDGDRRYSLALGRRIGPKTTLPSSGVRDATENFDVDGSGYSGDTEEGGYAESTLTDVRTGQAYRTRLPTGGQVSGGFMDVAAVPRKGGGLLVLVPLGTTLTVVRAEEAGRERFPAGDRQGKYALAPDGHAVARVSGRTLEVMNASRTRRQSVRLPAPAEYGYWLVAWTADSRRVVVWQRNGGLERAYAAQDLRENVPLPDAVPKAEDVDSVVGLQGSEVVLVTGEGTLARVDAAGGTVLGKPFLVHPGPNSNGPAADVFLAARLVPRPGHAGQVAVVTRAGGSRGQILLWDVRAPRRLSTLTTPAIATPEILSDPFGRNLLFSSDGSRLAVKNTDGRVRTVDVDRRKLLPEGQSDSRLDRLIGFGPGDSLITYVPDDGRIKVQDPDGGSPVTLAVSADTDSGIVGGTAMVVEGRQLLIDAGDHRRTFDLRPRAQFHALCAAAGRDYTKAERKLLPPGTPDEPPCS